jgi:hypothetical protein
MHSSLFSKEEAFTCVIVIVENSFVSHSKGSYTSTGHHLPACSIASSTLPLDYTQTHCFIIISGTSSVDSWYRPDIISGEALWCLNDAFFFVQVVRPLTHIWSYRCGQEWASLCLRQPARLISLYYIASRKYHWQKSPRYQITLCSRPC